MSRRNVLAGCAFIVVIAVSLWALAENAHAPAVQDVPEAATTTPSATDAENGSATPQSVLVRTDSSVLTKSAPPAPSTATLSVDGVQYGLTAPEGSTLKDAMDRLQSESRFTYAFKNYSGLGAFVTTIDNRASTADLVWILYVNGEKSGAGISSTRIRSGDVIEWKLEKSY